MSTKSKSYIFKAELPYEKPTEGITRQIMGYDGQIMLVKVIFEKGAIGYLHQHIHSQSTYIISGKFEVNINDEKKILEAGDGFYIEPNTPHGTMCIESGVLIDAFSPIREDFLTK